MKNKTELVHSIDPCFVVEPQDVEHVMLEE
jgi:hypothetical protein